MEERQMSAVIMYNSLICTAQTDREGASKQKREWKKFIDSLDWDKRVSKKEDPLKAFSSLKGYIMNRGVK